MDIPLFKIFWDERDVESVTKVIRKGTNWANGAEIVKFENKIAEYAGRTYAVTFNSGTSALHAALLANDIGPKDEVIVPSFTFIATANAPLFVGARPIFAEIEGTTYGLNPEDVQKRITSRTKAIMPIHYGGCPCQIKELQEIAEDNHILLIDDAAEALGAKIENRKIGSFGDSTIFSFCQNKIIATGEGGAVVTDSKIIFDKLKLIRSHGRLETSDYFSSAEPMDYITLGYNFRISSLTAALGLSQIEKLDEIISMRRHNAEYMTKELSKIWNIKLPIPPFNYYHVYQMFTIQTEPDLRNALIQHLSSKGIVTKIYFSPVHLSQFYKTKFGYKDGDLPFTEFVSCQVLSLPIYPTLNAGEIKFICETMEQFFEEANNAN